MNPNTSPQRVMSGFGIISPDTNVVQTFDGASPPSDPYELQASGYLSFSDAGDNDHAKDEESHPDDDRQGHLHRRATLDSTTGASAPSDSPLPPPSALPRLPRLARSFSMPVDPHLGHLRLPYRPLSTASSPDSVYGEMSSELADSVQAVIQTLLHLSPPHILDPVKEQFSACTVQLPTPSVSALLTTMKNLNFLSSAIRSSSGNSNEFTLEPGSLTPPATVDTFDIGEVVQSVGDVLGGVAAQAKVDLAIFHGDVGMRHINVMGDERSILFILTHVRVLPADVLMSIRVLKLRILLFFFRLLVRSSHRQEKAMP